MDKPNRPIIVGGCHRSGTTLVRRILDGHSAIHCGPEIKFLRDFHNDYFADPLQHIRFTNTARSVLPDDEIFEVLGRAFVTIHERAARRAGKRRWADKNPENALYLDAWQRLLGDDWVFIHIVRNPLDTLASIKDHPFPLTIPAELPQRVAYYNRYLDAGLAWAAQHPARAFRIVYEELVAAPERVVGALMEWLGETLEPAQLDLRDARHQQGIEDPKIRATNAVHGAGVGRWQKVLTRQEADAVREGTRDSWKRVDPSGKFSEGV